MKEVGVRIGKIKGLRNDNFSLLNNGEIVEAVIVKTSKGENNAYMFRENEGDLVILYSFCNEGNSNQFEIIEKPVDGVPKEIGKVYGEVDYKEKYKAAVSTIKEMSKLL